MSATGEDDATLDELMADASDDFKRLVARLEDWGSNRGYQWRPKLKSNDLVTSDGQFILRIYPQWGSLDVFLDRLVRAGMHSQIDDFAVK